MNGKIKKTANMFSVLKQGLVHITSDCFDQDFSFVETVVIQSYQIINSFRTAITYHHVLRFVMRAKIQPEDDEPRELTVVNDLDYFGDQVAGDLRLGYEAPVLVTAPLA